MNCKHRIQNFWQLFLSERSELEEALRTQDEARCEDLIREINVRLESICGCKALIEYSDDGFFELTFDTGPNKTVQYICELLRQCAPKELVEDWIINAWLPPYSSKAQNAVLRIKDQMYTGADFTVFYDIDDTNHCLYVDLYCPGFKEIADEDRKREMSAYMLELFIGELELEARIASIQAIDEPIKDSDNFCLLPNFYEDVCDIVVDQEWLEYHEPTNIYMAYKISEEPASDTLRKDMKLIITTNSLLQEELLSNNFDSCIDFRDKGGEYGYLYYENPYDDEKNALIRQTMEKKLNEMLQPLSIARTIGGAMGTHYSYIDLAIFDKDAFGIVLEDLNSKISFDLHYQAFLKD